MSHSNPIKPAHYAGSWYPHSPRLLQEQIGPCTEDHLSMRWQQLKHLPDDFFLDLPQEPKDKPEGCPKGRANHSAGVVKSSEPSGKSPGDEMTPEPSVPTPPVRVRGPVVGGILPHAGLQFSALGQLSVLRRIHWKPGLVVILAPSHRVPLPADTIITTPFGGYSTPLGILQGIPVESHHTGHITVRADHQIAGAEHALELLLPGIAAHLGIDQPLAGFILPSIHEITDHYPDDPSPWLTHAREALIAGVSRYCEPEKVLWLVSSDFTHYGPRFSYTPAGAVQSDPSGVLHESFVSDHRIAQKLSSLDAMGAFYSWTDRKATICGLVPSLVMVSVLREIWNGRVVGRQESSYTSLGITGISGDDADFVAYRGISLGLQ